MLRCCRTIHQVDDAFHGFLAQIQPGGLLIACQDDPGSQRALHKVAAMCHLRSWTDRHSCSPEQREACTWVITYGSGKECDVHVSQSVQICQDPCISTYNLVWRRLAFDKDHADLLCSFRSQLPGHHNMLNAAAAIVASSVYAVMRTMKVENPSQAWTRGTVAQMTVVQYQQHLVSRS